MMMGQTWRRSNRDTDMGSEGASIPMIYFRCSSHREEGVIEGTVMEEEEAGISIHIRSSDSVIMVEK